MFFTAHSLPRRAVAEGDPYPDQVAESAADIAALLGLDAEPRPDLGGGVAERGDGRPTRGSGPTCWARSAGWPTRGPRRWWCARWASSPTTSRSSTTSTSRPTRWPDRSGVRFARTPSLNDDPALPRRAGRRGPPGLGASERAERVGARVGATVPADRRRGRRGHRRPGRGLGAGRRRRPGRARTARCPTWWCSRPATAWAGRCGPSPSPAGGSTWPPTPSWPAGPRPPSCATSSAWPTQLVPVGASGAAIWARGRLRPMPDGLNLGVPTRWWPLLRSGILEPGRVRPGARATWSSPAWAPAAGLSGTGRWATSSAGVSGAPVVDRLADPLIGGIHAGDADQLSAAATFPVLLAASHQSGQPDAPPGCGPGQGRHPPEPTAGRRRCSGRWPAPRPAWSTSWPRPWWPAGSPSAPGTACQAVDRHTGRRPTGAGRARWDTDPGVGGVGTRCPGLPRGRRRDPGRAGPGDRGAARPPRPGVGRAAEHHPLRLGGGGHPGPSGGFARRAPAGHRLPGATHLHRGREAGPGHRVHLSRSQVAAPGPARGRADPGLGRAVRRRPARRPGRRAS